MELLRDVRKVQVEKHTQQCCTAALELASTKLQKNFYMCELVDFAYCANCYKLSQRPFHEQYGLNEKGRAIEYSSVGQVAFIDYKAMLEAGRNMYFDKTVNAPLEIVAVNIDRDESQPLS